MAPYTVQLDADTAHDLTQHGGTLLLLGVPLGTIFGLDQQVIKEKTSSERGHAMLQIIVQILLLIDRCNKL